MIGAALAACVLAAARPVALDQRRVNEIAARCQAVQIELHDLSALRARQETPAAWRTRLSRSLDRLMDAASALEPVLETPQLRAADPVNVARWRRVADEGRALKSDVVGLRSTLAGSAVPAPGDHRAIWTLGQGLRRALGRVAAAYYTLRDARP